MLFAAEDHAANAPETWHVVSIGSSSRRWTLQTKDGVTLESYETKRAALADREGGPLFDLYAKEGRWYAGETVAGWKPYAEVKAENERTATWLAAKSA